MKISEKWLREWVNPKLSAEEIGEQLTMAGLELDELTKVAKDFSGVVVGEVLTVTQHPDADKLKVTTVNVGQGEPLQIVCGAPNVTVGIKVPAALIGAKLPAAEGDDKPFVIKKGKLRGVESHGMLCGGSEIDCDDGVDGLLILPNDAPIGTDLRDYLGLDNHVLDISITPNRGDCFSIRGIARELAVLNELPFALPFEAVAVSPTSSDRQTVHVLTTDCPRYFAQIVSGLQGDTPSPAFIKEALLASGIRPRNLLVDVTNYVLLELGQPLHAFDADKLVGAISVRHANVGETLQLLNEQTITFTGDELVIADEAGVIALAGIMGGLRTAVSDDTTRVVIESAFFAPLAIAGRARRFGLHTDASQRFERGVDFALPALALDRAVGLLHHYGNTSHTLNHSTTYNTTNALPAQNQGQTQVVVGQKTLVETLTALPSRAPVTVSIDQINRLLGAVVATETMIDILKRLEIDTVLQSDGETLVCQPPSHRYDIAIPEDIVEEVARIYGYNNIANQVPAFVGNMADMQGEAWLHDLKLALVGAGYYEAVSFSFSDAKIERYFDGGDLPQPLALANPISSDLAVMRRTLLSSLLPCVQYNLNRQVGRVRLFETGLRFVGSDVASLEQIETLAMVAVGSLLAEQPLASGAMDFYDLKRDVELLLPERLVNQGDIRYVRSQQALLHPGQGADIVWQHRNGETLVGWLGQLHPQIADALDLPVTWVAQLDVNILRDLSLNLHARQSIQPLSKFPHVRRDIAIILDDSIPVQDILATIRTAAGEQLSSAFLFDVYAGDKLPTGKRSLAFGLIWQDDEATLADERVTQSLGNIVTELQNQFGATLRDS